MTKICSKCNIEKSLNEFGKNNSKKDGLSIYCKECRKIDAAKYYIEHCDKCKERDAKYYDEHKEQCKLTKEKWANNNPERIKLKNKRRYDKNPEKEKLRNRNYIQNNLEKYRETKAKYNKEKRLNDPLFRLTDNIRSLIKLSIKNRGYSKSSKTAQILGCTFEEFFHYIENQFQEGMNWDNRSLWHLDHIYPVSLAESEDHLIQLNHYTNFQPLWAEDNLRKGNKIL
jgi:hypothetical protein